MFSSWTDLCWGSLPSGVLVQLAWPAHPQGSPASQLRVGSGASRDPEIVMIEETGTDKIDDTIPVENQVLNANAAE